MAEFKHNKELPKVTTYRLISCLASVYNYRKTILHQELDCISDLFIFAHHFPLQPQIGHLSLQLRELIVGELLILDNKTFNPSSCITIMVKVLSLTKP